MPVAASSRAVCQVAGASSGPGRDEHAGSGAAQQLAQMRRRQRPVERGGDARQLRGQGRGDQLGAVGGHQGDRVGAAHAQLVQQVRVAVHVGEQLREGAPGRLLPALRVGQDGHRDPVGPQRRRAGQQRVGGLGQATGLQRHGLDHGQVVGCGVVGPQQLGGRLGGGHRVHRTGVRCLPRSITPSSVPTRGLDDVAVLQVARVVPLAAEEDLPLARGRQQRAEQRERLGRSGQRGADRGAGEHAGRPGRGAGTGPAPPAPAPAGRSCRRRRRRPGAVRR